MRNPPGSPYSADLIPNGHAICCVCFSLHPIDDMTTIELDNVGEVYYICQADVNPWEASS